MGSESSSSRGYVYELDPLRVVTAFCVVAVHTLGFTLGFNQNDTVGVQVQNAFVVALHFTRYVFMFVTAFALVYVYANRPFSPKTFWSKRALTILLPYTIWSVIYTFWNASSFSPLSLLKDIIVNILMGNASFQLYYILLTLQFYLLFPLFLLFLKRVAHHPWWTLLISFAVEIGMLSADYYILRTGSASSTSVGKFIIQYQDRFFLLYQFYFILGGLTALYLKQVRAFLLRHGKEIIGVAIVGLSVLLFNYVVQVRVYHQAGTVVLQPSIGFFSLTVIIFAFWLAARWARSTDQQGKPGGHHIWHTLSDASFGLYLIHALILDMLLRWLVPWLPVAWPVIVRVLVMLVLTASISILISLFFLNRPVLSRLVGRAYSSQRKVKAPQPVLTTVPLRSIPRSDKGWLGVLVGALRLSRSERARVGKG